MRLRKDFSTTFINKYGLPTRYLYIYVHIILYTDFMCFRYNSNEIKVKYTRKRNKKAEFHNFEKALHIIY